MKSITFPQFVNWLFYGAMGFLAMRGVNTLDKLEGSVSTLNEKMAVVVTKTETSEKKLEVYDLRFERQDDRIRNLELRNK